MTGTCFGAAGAIESIFTILALCDQIVPPTINLDNPDSAKLDFVPGEARKVDNMGMLCVTPFGFGGTNGSLIFRRYHGE